jgi:ABC-type branched-subunit amino acid transport system ATPase component
VAGGAVTSIIGPNGAGKTTLLNIVCGFYRPDAGSVRLGDEQLAGDLPHIDKRLLEIARALALRPTLLLLDEPAAGLNDTETGELAARLRKLRDEGLTILLVEHDMPMVMRICDRIVVLESGRKIAEGAPAAIRADPAVRAAYLGDDA